MKTVVVIFISLAIFIPNIALAAWWNPFSWKLFQRSESRNQILESRIKELESKLEENSSVAEEVKKEDFSVKKEVKVQPVISSSGSKTENYSAILSEAYLNYSKLVKILLDRNNLVVSYISDDLDALTTILRQLTAYRTGIMLTGEDTRILDYFIEEYRYDIEITQGNLDYFRNLSVKLDELEKRMNILARKHNSSYVLKETAITEITQLNKDEYLKETSIKMRNGFDDYKVYRKDRNNRYKEDDALLQGISSGLKSLLKTYEPVYKTPPTIEIQRSTRTNTSCDIYNNSVSCTSYTY